MTCTPITLTGTRTNPDGSPANGQVTFQLTQQMINGTEVVPASTIQAQILNGSLLAMNGLALTLLANDDAATTPSGSAYFVTEKLVGQKPLTYSINVPSAAPGQTIDLSAIVDFA